MQVMVAEHGPGVERATQPEAPQACGPAVHEIPQGQERILCGIEPEGLEQVLEFIGATLEVADKQSTARARVPGT